MSARTRVDFMALTISAGPGKASTWDATNGHHYRYTVKVQSDATNLSRSFRFHGSQNDYDNGHDQLSQPELLEAFRCFVSDAQAAEGTFADFCDEFGYDVVTARRTYDACRASLRKLKDLFHDDREPAFILDMLEAEGIS